MIAARYLRNAGTPVIAWRQGAYGAALVAADLDGYECGMESESTPTFPHSPAHANRVIERHVGRSGVAGAW